MPAVQVAQLLDPSMLGERVTVTQRSLDRFALAHDASHYLRVPGAVLTPTDAGDVARIFRAATAAGHPITFRSGGTSLSGQGVTDSILVDTRTRFSRLRVEDDGRRVRVQPGVTVRRTNAQLARFGRKLGPDPASEIACTIGGVVANNSSGMACGVDGNTYRTIESLLLVLPSGTILDTAADDADDALRRSDPRLHAGLLQLRDRVRASDESVGSIERQFAIKNTMGYALNSFLDYDRGIDILEHLVVGSEGTLAFVAEARFRTVEVLPAASTGLLVFATLTDATDALPALVAAGFATIELMDAQSLRVAQAASDVPPELAAIDVEEHCALLVELQQADDDALTERELEAADLFSTLPLVSRPALTRTPAERDALWHVRKGLYTAVAGARPSGTTALLEDIAVPVAQLSATCTELIDLFARHGYDDSVIFGHAKDGNIHFMLTERFSDPASLARYRRFTDEMVDLVLAHGGNLKAEHGTGRIMAPFVRRQYGDELYDVMVQVKSLFDPAGVLNPGVLLSDDPDSHLHDLKVAPAVESEVDRCVECGYCEPGCPSRSVTTTPRQRIVLRRELVAARERGDTGLAAELAEQYEYDAVETCAVDGLCAVACPVDINTGDLVRRLRAESRGPLEQKAWALAARHWDGLSRSGGAALSLAKAVPSGLPRAVTLLGRAVAGPDTVPLYDRGLPRGGTRRSAHPAAVPEAVFFSACIGTMFGPATGSHGVTAAFLSLCERAGVSVTVPEGIGSMCCGTPWKSKGYADGYAEMRRIVVPALLKASNDGELPIVCDAASCTEGLITMLRAALADDPRAAQLRIVDAVDFTAQRILRALDRPLSVGSLALHPTCSSTELGINPLLRAVADFVSDDVHVPIDWGCCAFAGDRGLLHPELTASATGPESAELAERDYDVYASVNRTCELGMSRATGKEYRHLLEVLDDATRVTLPRASPAAAAALPPSPPVE